MSGGQQLTFEADPRHARQLRADVRSAAAAAGAPEAACDALALVVDELFQNALEHGAAYRKLHKELAVHVGMVDAQLVLDFFDPEMPEAQVIELGRAMRSAADGMPALENERGRGLFLISVYMTEVRVDLARQGGLHLHGKLSTG